MLRTPAPLTVEFDARAGEYVVLHDSTYVCSFRYVADARAFVALPALMTALRDLIDAIPEPTLVDDPVLREWVGHAEAALAQADGPAPTEE